MINPFSIILLLIYLYIFIFKDKLKLQYCFVVYVILEIFVGVGYFVRIGSFELLYSEFSLIMLFIVSFKYIMRMPLNRNIAFLGMLLILSISFSIVLAKMINYNQLVISFSSSWDDYIYGNEELTPSSVNLHSILLLGRVIIFILICLALKWQNFFTKKNVKYVVKKFYTFSIAFLFLLSIEFLTKYIINPNLYTSTVNSIFGIGAATYINPIRRGGFYCLQGLSKEPSHLSFSLFFASMIFICYTYFYKISKKKKIGCFSLIQLFSFLTMSLSSIIFVAASIVLVVLFGKKNIRLKTFLILLAIGIAFIFVVLKISYFRTRIDSVILISNATFNNTLDSIVFTTTSGEVPRIVSILFNLRCFLNYPLFGLGLGSTYAHSFVASMLSNVGIVGVIIWLLFIKKLFVIKKYNLICILAIVGVFVLQGYLGTFYSLAFMFVILMYLYCHRLKMEDRKNGRYCNSQLQW